MHNYPHKLLPTISTRTNDSFIYDQLQDWKMSDLFGATSYPLFQQKYHNKIFPYLDELAHQYNQQPWQKYIDN